MIPPWKAEAALDLGPRDSSTLAWISVKLYVTREYARATADIPGTAEHIIAKTNQGYANSGVLLRIWIHCIEIYLDPEDYDGSTMLTNFYNYKSSMSELLGSADITMLLTSDSNVGGIAYVNTVDWPMGMATKYSAESDLTFGHEVGHIYGGSHDEDTVAWEGGTPPHAHGVGYRLPGTGKATILA